MDRRDILRRALGGAAMAALPAGAAIAKPASFARARPGDPGWPASADWAALGRKVGGRLTALTSPFDRCKTGGNACAALFREMKNPYFIGDDPALTQTLGWTDAWTSRTSAYAVAAESAGDVAAAVDFARAHRLRLVVKGGGHSYQGTSNAPDSLLVWTRRMDAITLHDGFVGAGCTDAPVPAVSVGSGAIWGRVYDRVCAQAGRYVQGGGCLTVGVAGLIQSGGFGSLSKGFGSAAASLIEAEIITADGTVRVVNGARDPELYWALKGGGGGSFGVVTRLTLATHPLPATIGAVNLEVKATSDAAYRALVARVIGFYASALLNPHWGEQIHFKSRNRLGFALVTQGLDQATQDATFKPLLDWITARPADYALGPVQSLVVPARAFWDPAVLAKFPGVVIADDRPGAPQTNIFWTGNLGEAGQVLHGYHSAWMPAALLRPEAQGSLVDALVEAARHWQVSLHFNKGLAGAPAEAVHATRDTATNPKALDAFALLICASEGPPAYPGVAGHEPDLAEAREDAAANRAAMAPIHRLVPDAGSYLSESDYFEADWRRSFWGTSYPRLLAAKRRYDPEGLFTVHHGVGSEDWSADGFTRIA